jgi:hypothetical protein
MPNSPPHRKFGVIAVAATAAIMLAFFLAANGTVNRRDQNRQTNAQQMHNDYVLCTRLNRLYRLIQKQVRQSIKDTPKIAYYRSHLADLARVQKTQQQELRAFTPQPCGKDGNK